MTIKRDKIAAMKFVDGDGNRFCRLGTPVKFQPFNATVAEQETWFVSVCYVFSGARPVWAVFPSNDEDDSLLGKRLSEGIDPADALDALGYELIEEEK